MNRLKQSMKNMLRILVIIFDITPELFFIIFFKTLLRAILPFINIIFSKLIIDEFMSLANYRTLIFYAIYAISLNVIILFSTGILTKRETVATAKLELQFDKKLNFHQMNFTLKDIESNRIKEFQRNLEQTKMRNGGMETIINNSETITRNILNLVLAAFALIYIWGIQGTIRQTSFWNAPWPLLILLFITVLSVALTIWLQAKQNEKISDLNMQVNEANGSAFQYMQLISDYQFGKDIRIYKLKFFLCNTFNNLWASSIGYKLTKKLGREKAIIPCFTSLCNSIINFLIFLLVIMKAITGGITTGEVVIYIGSIQIFTQSVIQLVNSLGEMIGYGELFAPFLILLNIPEETFAENRRDLPAAPYTIAFDNVSFQYSNTDKWALQDVSFTINHNQRTAFVGVNGSGKSTAIKLLCRFYEPQEGRITLNGINIKEFDLTQYRMFISVVFQDFSLLSLKLGANIACSDPYSVEQVLTAATKVGMTKNLDAYLFKDYDNNGIEISGGEAQKVSIARAIYKDAPFFILDEPTAALDPRAEAEIYENFDSIISNKTTIYISHRLSSCRFCDQIAVFDCGHLIQMGTHEQLAFKPGQYQKLWEAQAQFYKIQEV